MCVEERRPMHLVNRFRRQSHAAASEDQPERINLFGHLANEGEDFGQIAARMAEVQSNLMNKEYHFQLQADLIDYLWAESSLN